jgi:hypothetical protein
VAGLLVDGFALSVYLPPRPRRLQATGGGKMTNRHRRAPIDTWRGRIGPPGRDGGTGSPASRAAQFAPQHGNPPLENTTLRTGANGHLFASADMPPTMPAPETKNQKKVRWPTSMREPMPLGGSGPRVVRKKVRRITSARRNPAPTVTSLRPAITHNRRAIEPYSTPSSALIIPWSCVRITPGLVVFDDFRRGQSTSPMPTP